MRTALILILFVATRAPAQTNINIDFGAKGGTPPATYAGAGMPGIWNALTSLRSTPTGGIVDTDGNPTSITIASSQVLSDILALGTTSMQEPTRSLLSDYLCGITGDATLTFTGITPGRYRLITYAVPSQIVREDIPVTTVIPLGVPSLAASMTGVWKGALQEGATHTIHELTIPAGTFTLQLLDDSDVYSNGIQLIELPDPSGLGAIAIFAALLRRRQHR